MPSSLRARRRKSLPHSLAMRTSCSVMPMTRTKDALGVEIASRVSNTKPPSLACFEIAGWKRRTAPGSMGWGLRCQRKPGQDEVLARTPAHEQAHETREETNSLRVSFVGYESKVVLRKRFVL